MPKVYLINYPIDSSSIESDWSEVDTLTSKLVKKDPIQAVFVSDDRRRKLIAEFLTAQLKGKQLESAKGNVGLVASEAFRERNLGNTPYTRSSIGGHYLHICFTDENAYGGESKSAFRQRIEEAHDKYVKPALDQDQNLAIIGYYFLINEYRALKLHNARDVRMPKFGMAVIETNGDLMREVSLDILKW